jgi:putative ABC transport system permease protein
MKDNARMFFMVTIFSTVAFCAVGTLASMNVINKQFEVDYPAAISYVAKDEQLAHQQNLQQIETELNENKFIFSMLQFPIFYVEVVSASDRSTPEKLPVISFSDYKKVALLADFEFHEKPPGDNIALGMTTHRFENDIGHYTYTLGQNNIKVQRNDFTEHVVIPRELVENEGLIVNDDLFRKLIGNEKKELFTGYFIKDYKDTNGMLERFVNEGKILYEENKSYAAMTVSGTLLYKQMSLFNMMLFIALLIGAVFFIAAGSFLYFRLYADMEYDVRHYLTIMRVGLTDQELTKIVTQQLLLLFFIPIIVAAIHSIFAFRALQSYFTLSIANETIVVLVCFFLAQLIYFFFIRKMYVRKLKKSLI